MEITADLLEKTATRLSNKDLSKGKVFTVDWEPNLQYAWDNGVAIGRYLEELKQGRIMAKRCRECNRIMLPPRMFCERCWKVTDEWVPVKDTGTVNTFAISYVDWAAGRIPKGQRPYTPAVIEIDGASRGMGILHLVDEVKPEKIFVGMRVKAVWRPEAERVGAITDIEYFKPIG
ncbi:MAG: Zn-ribbon domain-containing OB-fold protein [Proteobacteria bacterium]|nr:Zn-ribbon domain-containing OB-fold protein [Pseudomonadota bacterium]